MDITPITSGTLVIGSGSAVIHDGNNTANELVMIGTGTAGAIHIEASSTLTFSRHYNTSSSVHGGAMNIAAGASLVLTADGESRYFFTSNTGYRGGALYNAGTLSIANATFEKNTSTTQVGGAIYNQDTGVGNSLVLENVLFSSNTSLVQYGGAISNASGAVSIVGGTFLNNTSKSSGGAIYSSGAGAVVSITNARFAGNNATSSGGAFYNNNSSSMTLTNVLINSNSSTSHGGAAFNNNSTLIMTNVVFTGNVSAGNGGAVVNTGNGRMVMTGGTFADNEGNNGSAIMNYNSAALIDLENVVFRGNGNNGSGGALYNTGTALLSGGDFSNNYGKTGGAINNVAATSKLVLDGVLFQSNTAVSGGNAGAVYNVGSSTMANVAFIGNVSGAGGGAVYGTTDAVTVVLSGTFERNRADTGGAMYNNAGVFTASSVVFTSNTASSNGGAFYNAGGVANITGARFAGNFAIGSQGGAINNDAGGDLAIIDAVFEDNYAKNVGGALYNSAVVTGTRLSFAGNLAEWGGAIRNQGNTATLALVSATFTGNRATHGGGAIFNFGNATLTGTHLVFISNTATEGTTQSGGAIYNQSATLVLVSSTFTTNRALASGGAVLNDSGAVTGTGLVFTSNTAGATGGAIYNLNAAGAVTLASSTFTGNYAASGGAIYNTTAATVRTTGVLFTSNTADSGGAIYNFASGVLDLADTAFENNLARHAGGAIYNRGSSLVTGTNLTFTSNTAGYDTNTKGGGAIYNEGTGTIALVSSTFTGNRVTSGASTGGGAVRNEGRFTGTALVFTSNTTISNGGAIYNTGASATLALNDTTFTANYSNDRGGAIYNDGASTIAVVTLTGGTFQGNIAAASGGAIHGTNGAKLNASDVLFASNTAATGGAISDTGSLALGDNLRFTGNTATSGNGGAINAGAGMTLGAGATFTGNNASTGGALYANTGDITLGDGATFTGNASTGGNGGAILALQGSVTLGANATFTGNQAGGGSSYGGAIAAGSNVTLGDNATFEDNTGGLRAGAINASGTVVIGHNATITNNRGNVAPGGAIYANGPVTFGTNAALSRNYSAQSGGAIYTSSSVTLGAGAYIVSNTAGNGNGGAVFANSGITLTGTVSGTGNYAGSYGGAFYVSNGNLDATAATVTLANNRADTGNGGAIFAAGPVALGNAATRTTLTGNTAGGDGGAIASDDVLTLNGLTVLNSNTATWGGAVYAQNAITLTGTVSGTGNTARSGGGALYMSSGNFDATAATLSLVNNRAETNSGGAIRASGPVTIGNAATETTLTGNYAGINGGAIYSGDTVTLAGLTTLNSNTAASSGGYGGAVYAQNAITLTGTVSGTANYATTSGGAFYVDAGDFTATGAILSLVNNRAETGVGGAIFADGPVTIGNAATQTTLAGNYAGDSGGAIYTGATVTLAGLTVLSSNTTTNGSGGAVRAWDGITLTGTVSGTGNYAGINGGAFYLGNGAFTATDATLSLTGNRAAAGGGAIYASGNVESGAGALFSSNTAGQFGGAIYTDGDVTINSGALFSNNTANNMGGAIYVFGDVTLNVAGGGTTTFTGNMANGTANAIHMNVADDHTLLANIASGGLLDMATDPISGEVSNGRTLTVTGTGGGLWKLGGTSAFTAQNAATDRTLFTQHTGTLQLSNAAVLSLSGNASAFTVANAGVLSLSGNAAINLLDAGGAIALAQGSTLRFDSTGGPGSTLTLTGATSIDGALLNFGIASLTSYDRIAIAGDAIFQNNASTIALNLLSYTSGTYTLLTANTITDNGLMFTLTGTDSLTERQNATLDWTTDTTKLNLILSTLNVSSTWNTAANTGIWSTAPADANWLNPSDNLFADGDKVTFNNSTALFYTVTVPSGTVRASDMVVNTNIAGIYFSGPGSIVTSTASTTLGGATGKLVKTGISLVALNNTGTNLFEGGIDIDGGILLGNTDTLRIGASGSVNIATTAYLDFDQTATGAYAGRITGQGGFVKRGSGNLTLTGSTDYQGDTSIVAGQLTLGNANQLASSSAVYLQSGGTLNTSGTNQTLNNFSDRFDTGGLLDTTNTIAGNIVTLHNTQDTAFSGTITGAGAITKTGAATLTLSGSNTYTGGLLFSEGAIAIANNQALGKYTTSQDAAGSVYLRNAGVKTIAVADDYTIQNRFVVSNADATNTLRLDIADGKTLTIDNAGIDTSANGGAIYIANGQGQLTFGDTGALVIQNSKGTAGGAIYTDVNTALTFTGSVSFLSNNAILNNGGALYAASDVTFDKGATLTGNYTEGGYGGAIYSTGVVTINGLTIINSNTASNTSWGTGGAVYADTGITLTGTVSGTGNYAGSSGGAFYSGGDFAAAATTLSLADNRAGGSGGAIHASGMAAIGQNATFTDNYAGNYGGAIYAYNGITIGSGALFSSNTADDNGGAIYTAGNVTLNVAAGDTTTFTGNMANGKSNAIYMDISGATDRTLLANIAAGGVLDMATDAISGTVANGRTLTITSTGGGLWRLGGTSNFTTDGSAGSKIAFTQHTGILRLSDNAAINIDGAASTFTLENGGILSLASTATAAAINVADGNITFNQGSRIDFNVAPFGATLTLTGTTTFDRATTRQLLDGATGKTNLISITGDAIFASTSTLALYYQGAFVTGTYTLLTATNIDTTTGTYTHTLDGLTLAGRQYSFLTETTNTIDLVLAKTNVTGTWTGAATGANADLWSTAATATNWIATATNGLSYDFMNGDAVVFAGSAGILPASVNVAPSGVAVASMTVTGGTYAFTGGIIASTTLSTLPEAQRTGTLSIGGNSRVTLGVETNFANGIYLTGNSTIDLAHDRALGVFDYLTTGYSVGRVRLDGTGALAVASNTNITVTSRIATEVASSGNVLNIDVANGGTLTFQNVKVASDTGGALFVQGNINSTGEGTLVFVGNVARIGGAIQASTGGSTVTLGGLTIINSNTAAEEGGAISAHTRVTLTGTLSGTSNYAGINGGAIRVSNGNLDATNATVTLTNNRVGTTVPANSGGAIYAAGNVALGNAATETALTDNRANRDGGAIFAGGTVTLAGLTTLNSNTASNGFGGAVYSNGSITLSGTVSGTANYAGTHGGAFYTAGDFTATDATLTLANNRVSAAVLFNSGGAIYVAGAVNIGGADAQTTLTGNYAMWNGGALNATGTVTLGGVTILNSNTAAAADASGGAVRAGAITLTGTVSGTGNYAGYSGGAFSSTATFTATDATLSLVNNRAGTIPANSGGAIFADGNVTIGNAATRTTFTGNRAGGSGGAIYSGGTVTLAGLTILNSNTATAGFGGAVSGSTGITLTGTVSGTGNFSGTAGGAFYTRGAFIATDATLSLTGNYAGYWGGAIQSVGGVTIGSGALFSDNAARNTGGAIHSNGDITIGSGALFTSNTAGMAGGAIYTTGNVALNVDDGDTTTFTGNMADGKTNAIHINAVVGSRTLTANVAAGGILDIADSVSGHAGNYSLTVTGTGGGLWKLGGTSAFTVGNVPATDRVRFTQHTGTLQLSKNAAINIDGTRSSFTLATGAVLAIDGANTINVTTGTIALAASSTLRFDIASRADADALTPMLALTAGAYDIGAIGIDINLDVLSTGTIALVSANAPGAFATAFISNTFAPTYNGEALDTSARITGTVGIGITDSIIWLQSTLDANNGVVTWTGFANTGSWNMADANWTGTAAGAHVEQFLHGDIVNFNDTAPALPATITISNTGANVITTGMYLSGNGSYAFTGNGITATTGTDYTTLRTTGAADDAVNGKLVLGGTAWVASDTTAAYTTAAFAGALDLTGITGTNAFENGIDIHSGALRISNTAQLGTTLAHVNFLGDTTNSGTLLIASGANLTLDSANGTTHRLTIATGKAGALIAEPGATLTLANANSGALSGAALNNAGAFTVANLVFTSNTAAAHGGAVYNTGTLTATNVTFTANNALTREGGALNNNGATARATIANALFRGNKADGGGAIMNTDGATLLISSATFDNNQVGYGGGAIINYQATLTGSNLLFSSNTASREGGAFRNNAGATATIASSTFSGNNAGYHGGAIANDQPTARLTLADVRFDNNVATGTGGALYNLGTVTGTNLVFVSNTSKNGTGGAIWNDRTLTLAVSSTFQNNTALTDGGAIYNTGTLSLAGASYFEGNRTINSAGGALHNSGTALLENATFHSNTAATSYGGAIYNTRTLTLAGSSTFTANYAGDNGGAIYNAENSRLTAANATFTGNTTDRAGGAIQQVVNSTLTLDGAYFANNTADYAGGALSNYGTSTFDITSGTFHANLTRSNGGNGGGAIDMTAGTGRLTDALFTSNTALGSAGDGGAIYTGTGINGGARLILAGTTQFRDNYAQRNGGALYVGLTVFTATNVIFTSNTAGANGGAVYNVRATTLVSSTFTANRAASGGALYNTATFTGTSLAFTGNVATADGGAVYASSGRVDLTRALFTSNTATKAGGALIAQGGTTTIASSTMQNNRALTDGGAIYVGSALANVKDTTFTSNTATGVGGAVFVYGGTFTGTNLSFTTNNANVGGAIHNNSVAMLVTATFRNNTSGTGGALFNGAAFSGTNLVFTSNTANAGGALYTGGGAINITNASFTDNRAMADGGAAYVNAGIANISGALFNSNTAANAGGALIAKGGTTTLASSTLQNNRAGVDGGAIYNAARVNMTGLLISSNTAGSNGGALFNWGGTASVVSSTFQGNAATAGDGGAIANYGVLSATNAVFTSNTAGNRGGAIYNDAGRTLTLNITAGAILSATGNAAATGTNGGFLYNDGNATINVGTAATFNIGALNAANAAADTIAGTAAATLTKTGAGLLNLNADNAGYTGLVTVSAGTLALNRADTLRNASTIDLNAAGATLLLAANQTTNLVTGSTGSVVNMGAFNLTIAGNDPGIFSGTLLGSGTLIKDGAATARYTLSGTQALAQNMAVNSGVLKFNDMPGYENTGAMKNVFLNTATAWLDLSDNPAWNPDGTEAYNWNGLNITGQTGNVIGTDDRIDLGSGTTGFNIGTGGPIGKEGVFVVIDAGSGTAWLTGSNDYVGYTRIDSGVLAITGSHQLGSETGIVREVILNGGNLAITADYSNTQRAIELRANGAVDVTTAITSTWNELVGSDTLAITKTGDGELVFANAMRTGTAGVLAGTLRIEGFTLVDALDVSAAATAALNGISIVGAANVNGLLTTAAGADTAIITALITGTAQFSGTTMLDTSTITGTAGFAGAATLGDTLVTTTGQATFNNTLNVTNTASIAGVVTTNSTAFIRTADISGTATFNDVTTIITSTINGLANFVGSSTLGATTINGVATLNGPATIGIAFINGLVTSNSTADIGTALVAATGTLNLNGATTIATGSIGGVANINADTTIATNPLVTAASSTVTVAPGKTLTLANGGTLDANLLGTGTLHNAAGALAAKNIAGSLVNAATGSASVAGSIGLGLVNAGTANVTGAILAGGLANIGAAAHVTSVGAITGPVLNEGRIDNITGPVTGDIVNYSSGVIGRYDTAAARPVSPDLVVVTGNIANAGVVNGLRTVSGAVANDGLIRLASAASAPTASTIGGALSGAGVVRYGKLGDTLTIGALSGSQTFDNIQVDFFTPAVSQSAKLNVTGIATGTHTMNLVPVPPTAEPANHATYSIALITAGAGSDAVFDANDIDFGMYTYTLYRGDGGLIMPDLNKWYLSRSAMSRAADAILETAGVLGTDWHYSLDSLHLRMGDLRAQFSNSEHRTLNSELSGNIWIRGNAYRLTAANPVAGDGFEQNTQGVTAGADKAFEFAGGVLYAGGFMQMGRSDRDHNLHGNSTTSGAGIGAYATWIAADGFYVDATAKVDRYKNDLRALAADGFTTTARYNNNVKGLSVELGQRMIMRDRRFFIEPSVQAAIAWIDGVTYDASNGLAVRIDNADALQYRAQVRAGAHLGRWIPYIKFAEVKSDTDGGELHVEGRSFNPKFDGWRLEAGAGASYLIDNRSQLYLDYEYSKAALYERPWSLNLGYRRAW